MSSTESSSTAPVQATSLENFNTNLEQFLQTIIQNYPDQRHNIEDVYTFPIEGDAYLSQFYSNCSDKGMYISNKNEIIFSRDVTLLNGVDFHTIWNDPKISVADKQNIWKYLHTLFLFSFEHKKYGPQKHRTRAQVHW